MITAMVLLVALVPVAISAGDTGTTQREPEPITEAEVVVLEAEEVLTEAEPVEVYKYPFNTMSQDWEAEQLEGFKEYTIPEDYKNTGGEFPLVMQQYLWITCEQCGFDYATALVVVEMESGYKWDTQGTAGEKGYMQVIERYHEERMERLGVTDIENPFQNVRVGVDLLAELKKQFGSINKALTAYNFGVSGAYEHVWDKGLASCEYSRNVMAVSERIRKELGQ